MARIRRGCTSSIWRTRNGSQRRSSSGSGLRLRGGRHLSVFAMNTWRCGGASCRVSPRAASMRRATGPPRRRRARPGGPRARPAPRPRSSSARAGGRRRTRSASASRRARTPGKPPPQPAARSIPSRRHREPPRHCPSVCAATAAPPSVREAGDAGGESGSASDGAPATKTRSPISSSMRAAAHSTSRTSRLITTACSRCPCGAG